MKKSHSMIAIFLLFVFLLMACEQGDTKERTVVYSAYLDNAASSDITIHLFDDRTVEIYSVEPGRFAEGESSSQPQYAATLSAAEYKEITERIEALGECKKETGNLILGAPWITAEANGKEYVFVLGSEVNVWHSYVANFFLKYFDIKFGYL